MTKCTFLKIFVDFVLNVGIMQKMKSKYGKTIRLTVPNSDLVDAIVAASKIPSVKPSQVANRMIENGAEKTRAEFVKTEPESKTA